MAKKKTETKPKATAKKAPAKKAEAPKAPAKPKVALNEPITITVAGKELELNLRRAVGGRVVYQNDERTVLLDVADSILK